MTGAWREAAVVAIGGGLGAVARFGLATLLAPWSAAVPFNYVVINVGGSFAIGVVLALTADLGRLGPGARLFWAVGVIGGFTTFSTFEAGIFELVLRHHILIALSYGAGSLAIGLAAAFAGLVMARLVWRERGRDRKAIRAG